MPFSYIYEASPSGTEYDYSAIELLSESIETHDQQLRIFVGETELESGVDYTLTPDTTSLTLEEEPTEPLLILRQTRMDRMYTEFTNVARLKAAEINLFRDQILFICQEINEEAEIYELVFGLPPTIVLDDDDFSVTYTDDTDDTLDYSMIPLIRDDRFPHALQLEVVENDVVLVSGLDYEVDPDTELITISTPPVAEDVIYIRRRSQLTPVTSDSTNASPLASGIISIMYQHLLYVIEELPYALGLEHSFLRNRRRPRRISFLRYSGPGDRFPWHGLPWNPDSTVIVYQNDTPLTEPDDYTISLPDWTINLPTPIDEDDTITIVIINFPDDPVFPDNPLDEINEQQDEVPAAVGTAPAVVIPTFRDANWNTDTETEDEENLDIDINATQQTRLAFDLTEFRRRNLGNTRIGLTMFGYPSVATGVGLDITVYLTDSSYDTANAYSTTVVTTTNEGSWITLDGLEDEIYEALIETGGVLYVVLSAPEESLEFHSIESEVDTAERFCPRIALNGAAFPSVILEVDFDLSEPVRGQWNGTTRIFVGGVSSATGGNCAIGRTTQVATGTYYFWTAHTGGGLSSWNSVLADKQIIEATLTFRNDNASAGTINLVILHNNSTTFTGMDMNDIDNMTNAQVVPVTVMTSTGNKEMDVTDEIQNIADAGTLTTVPRFIFVPDSGTSNDVIARLLNTAGEVNPHLIVRYSP